MGKKSPVSPHQSHGRQAAGETPRLSYRQARGVRRDNPKGPKGDRGGRSRPCRSGTSLLHRPAHPARDRSAGKERRQGRGSARRERCLRELTAVAKRSKTVTKRSKKETGMPAVT